MNFKIFFAIPLFLVLGSCKQDDFATSGQVLIKEINAIIDQNEISEIQVRPLDLVGFAWPPYGQRDFSLQNETIRVGNNYYNVNRLTEYWVTEYFDESNRQVFVLVIVLDI